MLRRTLSSGLRVIIEPSHAAPVAAAQVWVQVGSADELPHEAGLAHVHEHMLFKGTARRPVGAIAGDIEGAGGSINAFTSFDQTVYHVTVPSREVDLGLDILADAVQHSAFDPEELERELEVVLEELRRGLDSPGRVVTQLLFEQAFRQHTYGRPIIGYVETVEKFDRELILQFYRKWYRPENMLLVVAGDVDPEKVLASAERLFVAPAGGALPERPRLPEPRQDGLRFAEKAMDVQETQLQIAWPGPALSDPDTPALDVLSVLLGTGESSRLYRKLKREQQLVTDCHAYAYTPQDPGLFGVGAQVQGKPVDDALRGLLYEAFALRYAPPTSAEVEKARTIIKSESVYGKQTVQGRARKLGFNELVAGDIEFESKYQAAVAQITPEDVLRVAKAWLDPARVNLAMVRPESAETPLDPDRVSQILSEVVGELEARFATPTIVPLEHGVVEAKLSNGATVLVQPDASVPLVSMLATAKGGLLAETAPVAGVSHLVSELMVRGTRRFSAEQISETLDGMASGVAGQSGRNSLGLRGEFMKEALGPGLDIFTSCLLEPTFPEEELERERQSALEDLVARSDNPSAIAFDAFAQALFGEHPYGWTQLGTEASLRSLTREDVFAAYRSQLAPERLSIAVVGDVDPVETVRRLELAIGRAHAHPEARPWSPPAPPQPLEQPSTRELRRDKAQVQLLMGYLGVDLRDERRFALEVLSQVLGGQAGRLFLELRDRQSLAYAVGAFNLEGLAPGYFAVHIGTHPDKLEVAERGMQAELDRVCAERIPEDELARAKRHLIGSFEIGLQRTSSRASSMALNRCYGLGYDAHVRHAAELEAVTAEQVRAVARDLIRPERRAKAVVGPNL